MTSPPDRPPAETPAGGLGPSPACRCPTPWPSLVTVVEGRTLAAVPADTPGPAAALYRARCGTCGTEYPLPWRLARPHHHAA
ncbi:hypothetical protein [Streptomyces megasporus]|uniref:hypothetical protein n=1 Tax=Streptomyces megasporus TaxID=44060 RepID=UPI0004E1C6A0|nr:hypothetical protein [Streptomyces megasporus]